MNAAQRKVVDWALAQVGYVARYDKVNKYAEFMDATRLYNGPKNGFDWCDVFVDCDYVKCFGIETARRMTNQPMGGGGAGCWLSAGYYRDAGQWSDEPDYGRQVFFGPIGDEGHTGVVADYDGDTVWIVEGNTGYSMGYEGGAVLKQAYSRWDSRIAGYGVPKWSLVHEPKQEPGAAKGNDNLLYRAHVQDLGWLDPVRDGQTAGITGESLRLEAIKLTPPEGVELAAFAHVQDIGTLGFPGIRKGKSSETGSSESDPIIGTVGLGKRLEALRFLVVRNDGPCKGKKLRVQVHVQDYGWRVPVGEDEWAGTIGQAKRIEAVRLWFE